MKIGTLITKIINQASSGCLNLGICLVVFAMLSVLYGVLMRALHLQASWVVEITRYNTGAIMFLAVSYVQRERGHVRVEFVIQRLSYKAKKIMEMFGSVSGLVFIIALIWRGWTMAYSSFERGIQTPGYLNFPVCWPQAIMAFGFTLVALQLILIIISDTRALRAGWGQ